MSNQIIRAVCPHDCPDTCAMLVELDASGRAVRVKGDPENPYTRGGLCVKVAHYEKRTYHADRLLYPMKRAGRKGEGKFERISWDEAFDTIAAKLKDIARENPQSILPYSYAGTMALLQGSSMMHIVIRVGFEDREYIDRYTVGFDELRARVQEYPPSRVSEITGISESTIERLTREYATQSPAFIRVNYGLQRHAGGGMAVRNIFCLPALIGAWRFPGGGAVLSTSGFFKYNYAALERPDLIQGRPRTINMSRLGEALTNANPPVRAIVVYNTNPGAIAPNQQRVLEGFKRDDLFTVVLEHFQPDTADYADILLPATTQLEHLDIHRAYGHTYAMLNTPAIRPLGESKPNTEIFRLLAKHMGFAEPCFEDSDEDLVRQALTGVKGISLDELKQKGWVSLRVGDAPFAEGNFPTPSGKCECYSERLKDLDPLPTYIPPREDRISNPALAQEFPLVLISPPAHHFLNSTFVNLFQEKELGPTLEINATDAAARHIVDA